MPSEDSESIVLQTLGPDDEHVLANVHDDVFDHPVELRWTREFLNDPRHHIVVAIDNSQVIGFVSALHYVHPDKPPELWINEASVAGPYRNRGIGRRLLAAMFEHGKTLGCRHSWVATEKHNKAARRLYEVAGGVESPDDIVMSEFDLAPSHSEGEEPQ